jgi:hypothetical protein
MASIRSPVAGWVNLGMRSDNTAPIDTTAAAKSSAGRAPAAMDDSSVARRDVASATDTPRGGVKPTPDVWSCLMA